MHHQRRRSGHASGNSSMTDVRKAVSSTTRPATMTRRTTPTAAPKLGKNPRDREREWEEERWWDEERESFPQYCMICEKQFVPSDDRFLYCSDTCRTHDQTNAAAVPSPYSGSHHSATYPLFSGAQEPRDIIPRASPSRPSSARITSPMSPDTSRTSAMSALKSISIRSPTPPSPVGTYHGNGIWPFGRSATSPGNSYSRPTSGLYASTYDGTFFGAAGANLYGTSSDRPLPIRRPGIYSRPKSIELVTPMVGR
ncbi:hypothetical protein B0T18DRAFT_433220 [Schizothecium vesticola]|uniref:Life-span regulatory factor domain-containing protein n=1 Tax=Schizothecium vesticola TaxID=314040 RepID=A0AA40EIJ1_9PEZI|nr:hypothetical protein B0T18DRAFT_433220 [Schizothecium vesticola]